MQVTFSYEPQREVIPLRFGLGGLNDSSVTPLAREAVAVGFDLADPALVAAFIESRIARENIDVQLERTRIEDAWRVVELEVVKRFANLFLTDFDPGPINGYLTIGTRCPYNFARRFFYVPALDRSPVQLCLHELFHFYTHRLIEPLFQEAGVPTRHNEFKEALTVLLNTEFADLIEKDDQGYPQHQELRADILAARQAGKSIYAIAQEVIRQC